jgi:hypothetical protein
MKFIDGLTKEIINEFESEFLQAGETMQTFIIEEKRNYPRETIRREGVGITGKIAKSPRDVVDTGELRDSFSLESEKTKISVKVTAKWDAEHAEDVYFGHDDVPPYPWVDAVLRRFTWS